MEPVTITGRPPAAAGGGAPAGPGKGPAKAAGKETTTPGFAERGASMKGKPASAAAPRGGGGGGGGGGGHAAGGAKKGGGRAAPKPSLGDPALDKWKAATAPAIAGVTPGELGDPKAGASLVEKKGTDLASTRKGQVTEPVADAKAQQPPIPKEEPKAARLNTAEADAAIQGLAKAGEKKLSDQAFAPVGSPPKYEATPLTPSDYVPKNLTTKAAELEAQLAGLTDESKRAALTKQLEGVKKQIAGIEASAGKGAAPDVPKAIVDQGASKLTPPDPAMGDVLGDAIARAMQSVGTRSESIVKGAVAAAHGDKVPKMLEMGTSERPALETELKTELTGIAAASGITKEQLDAKVIEQQAVVDAQKVATEDALQQSSAAAVTTRTEQTTTEGSAIAGAKVAVQQEIEDKEAAVNGPPDTAAIEAKRDELLGTLESTGATAEAALRSSLTKRNTELDAGAAEKKQKINSVANTQAAAIRRHWANDTDPNKGMVEARPTTDWAAGEVGKVDGELKRMKESTATENAQFVTGVTNQLQPGREKIRDWAAHQEGTERSWWDRLIDMFRDWGHRAKASNEAWEKQRNADSRDSMAKDLDVLAELKKAQLDQNHEGYSAAMSKLTAEQQELAQKYLAGGVDSIGFVAESTMMRIAGRRKPELAKTFEERALAEWDWESLGQLARATNPGFQPKVLANKVHGGVDGLGTNEAKVFAGLGGARTPVERKALEQCYLATFGSSMSDDVKDDLSSEELDRGMALIEGDQAKADAAAIAEAVDGLGTDEKAIREALRGKTPEELDQIKKIYREKYGVDLVADLREDMGGAELDNALMLASGDTDGADAAELEDAMSGPGTDEDKMKQVYERIREEEEKYALARGLTKAEVDKRIKDRNGRVGAKYAAMGYGDLKANAKDELADGDPLSANNADNKLFAALEAGDEKNIDAAKALVEKEGVYTSDDEVEKIVRNQRKKAEFDVNLENAAEKAKLQAQYQSQDISKEAYQSGVGKLDFNNKENKDRREAEIAAKGKANVAQLKTQYEGMANTDVSIALHGKNTFDSLVDDNTSGYSKAEINALLESGGKLSDAQEMYFATAGVGTDEDKIKETLKDKTPAEIKAMKAEYELLHGLGSFESDILGDLSGREDLDVGLNLKYGDPSTFARQLDEAKPEDRAELLRNFEAYLTKRRDFEKSGSVGSMMDTFGDGMNSADQLKDAIDRAKKYDEALSKAEHTPGYDPTKKGDNPDLAAAQANFDMNFQGAVQAQEEVREKIDAITDIAAQIGGAIAGIAVTILTAGTATAAVIALYAAVASAATSIALKMSMKGAAYGWEDLGIDIATGVVDGVMSYATAGMGKAVMASVERAVMSNVAKFAAKQGAEEVTESAVKAFIKEAIEEGIENGVQAIPSAFVGGVLNGEDPVAAAKGAGMAGMQGAGMGMGMHAGMKGAGAAHSGIKGALKNEPTIETGSGAHAGGEPHSTAKSEPSLPDSTAPDSTGPGRSLPDPSPADVHLDDPAIKAAAHEGGVDEPGALLGDSPDPVAAQAKAAESGGPKADADERMKSPEKKGGGSEPGKVAEPEAGSTAEPGATPAAKSEAPIPISDHELATLYGMPADNVATIKNIAKEHGVLIDVRPTTPHAEPMLREGTALPKPEKIKAKTVNELDVQLGLTGPENLGKAAIFKPDQMKMPENFMELPHIEQDALVARLQKRMEEWNSYNVEMLKLQSDGKIRIEPDGTITNTGLVAGGEKPFTGDHDVFDIRKADGTKLSAEEYTKVKEALMDADCDVMHGAVTGWEHDNPLSFGTEAGQAEFKRLVADHSAGGKEPLIRFGDGDPKQVWHEPATQPGPATGGEGPPKSGGEPSTKAGGGAEAGAHPDPYAGVEPKVAPEPDGAKLPQEAGAHDGGGADPKTAGPKPELANGRAEVFLEELPEDSSMMFEGAEFPEAKSMYDNNIAESPTRETALMKNRVTGEYVIIQGSASEVDLTHRNFSELFPEHPDQWEMIRHSHPSKPGESVVAAHMLPSGNGGDLSVLKSRAERFNEKQVSVIDFEGPDGPQHTTFSYDPATKRIEVDYPNPEGGRSTVTRNGLEDYHEWYEKEFPGYSAGDSFEPVTVREGRGAAGPREPDRVRVNEPDDDLPDTVPRPDRPPNPELPDTMPPDSQQPETMPRPERPPDSELPETRPPDSELPETQPRPEPAQPIQPAQLEGGISRDDLDLPPGWGATKAREPRRPEDIVPYKDPKVAKLDSNGSGPIGDRYRASWEGAGASGVLVEPLSLDSMQINDVFRGELPSGSAGRMVADTIRSTPTTAPTRFECMGVVNTRTLQQFLNEGVPIAQTLLGQTLATAAQELGGEVVSMTPRAYRGKLCITVIITYAKSAP